MYFYNPIAVIAVLMSYSDLIKGAFKAQYSAHGRILKAASAGVWLMQSWRLPLGTNRKVPSLEIRSCIIVKL